MEIFTKKRKKMMRFNWMMKDVYSFFQVGFLVTSVYMLLLFINGTIVMNDIMRNTVFDRGNESFSLRSKQFVHMGPRRLVFKVSCSQIIEGNSKEITKAKLFMRVREYKAKADIVFVNLTKNCEEYKVKQRFTGRYFDSSSKHFPIAYSILMHDSVEQTEFLLRGIYTPFNIYCIHIDDSASRDVKNGMAAIAKCFDNVFIVSRPVDVIYNHFSRLQADLNCMSDLLQKNVSWKYLINVPSTQYPLKTNTELVTILKIYNGSNDIEGITKPSRMMSHRITHSYYLKNNNLKRSDKKKSAPPHNITVVKGSAYGVFSREFVQFVLQDRRARDFLEWTKDILSPDEYYWATLNHNPGLRAPGHYTGKPDDKPWLAAYAAWSGRDRCHGYFRHGVCVFGTEDLNELISRKELFANKFQITYQPLTLSCLEEWLYNRSFNAVPFETFYYKQLPFIRA